MPTSGDLLAGIGIIATLVVSAYATYWAFSIRHALAAGAYRRQALGIGVVALVFPIGFFAGTESFSVDPSFFWFVPLYASFATVLFWVDASTFVARRSDPLMRDTLHWTRLRAWVWSSNVAIMAAYLAAATYAQTTQAYLITAPPPLWLIVVQLVLVVVDAFLPLALAAVLLTIGATRSGDPTLHGHLRWFGLFALFGFLATLASAGSYPEHHSTEGLFTYLGLFVGGYFLYRSARSLAPLNRLTPIELE